MTQYQATLFHPDGGHVRDFTGRETVEDVWSMINDMGSRWIFYPLCFVTTQKVVIDTPEGLEFLKGKHIKTVERYLASEWKTRADEICKLINDGMPCSMIYN